MEYVYICDSPMDYMGIYDWPKFIMILISFAIFMPHIIAGRLPVYCRMAEDEELQREGTASATASGTTSLVTASPCRSVVRNGVNMNAFQEYLYVSGVLFHRCFTRRNHGRSVGGELSVQDNHDHDSLGAFSMTLSSPYRMWR